MIKSFVAISIVVDKPPCFLIKMFPDKINFSSDLKNI